MTNTFNTNINFTVNDFKNNTVPFIADIGTGWNKPEQVAYRHIENTQTL